MTTKQAVKDFINTLNSVSKKHLTEGDVVDMPNRKYIHATISIPSKEKYKYFYRALLAIGFKDATKGPSAFPSYESTKENIQNNFEEDDELIIDYLNSDKNFWIEICMPVDYKTFSDYNYNAERYVYENVLSTIPSEYYYFGKNYYMSAGIQNKREPDDYHEVPMTSGISSVKGKKANKGRDVEINPEELKSIIDRAFSKMMPDDEEGLDDMKAAEKAVLAARDDADADAFAQGGGDEEVDDMSDWNNYSNQILQDIKGSNNKNKTDKKSKKNINDSYEYGRFYNMFESCDENSCPITLEDASNLRNQVVLGSSLVRDYQNDMGVNAHQLQAFFMGYVNYVQMKMLEDGLNKDVFYDQSYFQQYNNDLNLGDWYLLCKNRGTLPCKLCNNEIDVDLESLDLMSAMGSLYEADMRTASPNYLRRKSKKKNQQKSAFTNWDTNIDHFNELNGGIGCADGSCGGSMGESYLYESDAEEEIDYLIDDEQEAIDGYNKAIDRFNEIKDDEQEHIDELNQIKDEIQTESYLYESEFKEPFDDDKNHYIKELAIKDYEGNYRRNLEDFLEIGNKEGMRLTKTDFRKYNSCFIGLIREYGKLYDRFGRR